MLRITSLLAASSLLVACTGEISSDIYSPSDPAEFDEQMFDQDALDGYDPIQRAYVQGHALAVYSYGKTLPGYIGHKGYAYEPGISAPDAEVAYIWSEVMLAKSGGVDGIGSIEYGGCTGDDDVCTDGNGGGGGEPPCEDGDDVCGGGGGGGADGGDPPGGGGDGGGGDIPPDDSDDPWVDPDCEEFLDPAALDARWMVRDIDPNRVLGSGASEDQLNAFYRGVGQALYMQDLQENTSHSEVEHLKLNVQAYGLCEHSPLVLDLDGDGIHVSNVGGGVPFDLLQRGIPVRTAWPSGDDALLAIDRDGDGMISHGGELFGNSLRSSGNRYQDGFASLAELDDNADGIIDSNDTAYGQLVLWRDADRNGVSSDAELVNLADAGIWSIELGATDGGGRDESQNRLGAASVFVRVDTDGVPRARQIVDVWFRYAKMK